MSLNQFVKIQSEETGTFTSKKNLLTFRIEGGEQYNLSNSYLDLTVTFQQDISDSLTGAIYNQNFVWKDSSDVSFPNAALVKHSRLNSSQKGMLESRRHNDVLITQLKTYNESVEDLDGTGYQRMNQLRTRDNIVVGTGLELVREGTRASRLRDGHVRIALSDLIELGKAKVFPGDKLGTCFLKLEMNFDKIVLQQLQGDSTRNKDFGTENNTVFQDVSGISGELVTLTTKNEILDIRNSPYYVNQPLSFSSSGSTLNSRKAMITEIFHNKTTNKLTLTLSPSLHTSNSATDISGIVCDGADAHDLRYNWTQAEIVLERLGKNTPMKEMTYMTYLNEADNGNGIKNFSRQYHLEPNCFNVLVAVPDMSSNLICLDDDKYESYRFRCNNKDLTDRDVEVSEPLYYDGISRYAVNQNMKLKNLREENVKVSNRKLKNDTVFIGTNVPLTQEHKLLQVDIKTLATSDGLQDIQLYKSVMKTVKL